MPTEAPPPLTGEVSIQVEADIVTARRVVRDVTVRLGFEKTDTTRIVTGASELARNAFKYAGGGLMRWRIVDRAGVPGIELHFEDKGPGIPDIKKAMQVGYSSSGGLGMGLPGTKKLMDEMDLQSEVGRGTVVVVRKWLRKL